MYQSLKEDGTILEVDKNWLNFMGYKKKNVIGRFFGEFVTFSSLYKLKQNFNDLKKYGKTSNVRFQLKKKDGSVHEALLNAIAVHDEQEAFRHLNTILGDIDLFRKDISETMDYQTGFNNAVEQKISEIIDKETLLAETEQLAHTGSFEWNSLTKKIRLSNGINHIFDFDTKDPSLNFQRLYRHIHPDDRRIVYYHLKNVFKNRSDNEFICRIITHTKGIRHIKAVIRIKNPHAQVIRIVGVISDITEQYAAKEELYIEHQLLQTMIDGIDYSVMMINPDYTVKLMNKAAREGIDTTCIADMQHPKCYEISHRRTAPCNDSDQSCPMINVMDFGTPSTVLHTHADGTFSELLATPLKNEQGNVYAMIESKRDITSHMQEQNELRMQKQILSFQVEHDALTGLPNRALFFDRFNQSIKKARRTHTKCALMFIDLDHFKEINDTLGHSIGDKVLIEVADKFHSSIREVDTLARLSGDEFTIILESITHMQDVAEIANKLLHTLQMPLQIDGIDVNISTSIGISIFPDDGDTSDDLLHNADMAMYKAKDSGKNQYHYYAADMTERLFERSVTENCLRQSVHKNELIIYYQPQINAKNNTLIGVEALVRWDLADLGIVLPSQFMPLAKEISLQQQIDNWMMKQAMTQVAQWYKQGLKPGQLSLNLSMDQLHVENFLLQLEKTLIETGCHAEWLIIELKEEQLLKDPEKTIARLQQIRDLGIGLAIDDFGMGTTSLSHLIRLPITKLKIDHSFVRYIPESKPDVDLIRSVIALTKSIDLNVVTVGVETDQQKEFLLQEGCSDLQGFLYAQPMPAEQMSEYLLTDKTKSSSVA